MSSSGTAQSYFTIDPKFETWLGKPLSEDGTYEGDEGTLSEWYNGVYWNTRIRVRSGGHQITEDLVSEGCDVDRETARRIAEQILLDRLRGLTRNAINLGLTLSW